MVLSLWCLFPSDHRFFGLDLNYREALLEQFYVLMQRLNVSYSDLQKMPVRYRTWFIERIIKDQTPKTTSNMGGVEIDDDTPISQVLGKKNS